MPPLDDPSVRAQYEEQLPRMSFGDHLDELRSRLIRGLLAFFVAFVGVMFFKSEVQHVVTEPYRIQWRRGFERWAGSLEAEEAKGTLDAEGKEFLAYIREHRTAILSGDKKYKNVLPVRTGYLVPYTLVATGGLEDMWMFMMASFVFALVLSGPVVIWQAWAFLAAGLYLKERKLFYRYFPMMLGLGALGVLFGYYGVLPFSLGFLISWMDSDQVGAMLSVGQYFTLVFALTAAMSVVFQLPLVMVALQRVGLVTHRGFVKNWRITVLIIFVVAAILTPPEPVSMLLMAAPMLLLYALGLGLTWSWRSHETKAVEVAP